MRLDRARHDKPQEFTQTPLPFGVAETLNGREVGRAHHLAWSEVSNMACPFVNTSFSGAYNDSGILKAF